MFKIVQKLAPAPPTCVYSHVATLNRSCIVPLVNFCCVIDVYVLLNYSFFKVLFTNVYRVIYICMNADASGKVRK